MNKMLNKFTHDDYEIIERKEVYRGVFRMTQYQIRYRLFQGGFSRTVMREVMERKSAAGLLPYDPKRDQVILIEQFRPGAIANPESPWLLEIVAGVFDRNEKPTEVAQRETKEEADCDVIDIYPITEFFVSPGGSNEYFWLYCGRIDIQNESGIHGLMEEDENIRAFCIDVDDAFRMVDDGEIKTSPAIIALQWLKLNREWLRQLWLTKPR